MGKLILSAFLVVMATVVTEATVCTSDTDCGSNECCYIKPEFMVVSRRRQLSLLPQIHQASKTGVCEVYRASGDQCGPLETVNGHCGCVSGQSCQWVPEVTTPGKVIRRKLVAHEGPGAYRCACEAYRAQGDHCDTIETMNGHCGCATGMSCQWVPEVTTQANKVRRRPVHHNEPGAYRCVCEQYRAAGDHCDSLETMNGHCGCASGMHCRWVPDVTTVAPAGRRSMVYHPEPGSYQCA